MVNPWRTCELLFNENGGHFIERAKERCYSGPNFRDFLVKGKKQVCSKNTSSGQDYNVSLGKWNIRCKMRRCNIVLGTIFKTD
jgi:hypothetical protein